MLPSIADGGSKVTKLRNWVKYAGLLLISTASVYGQSVSERGVVPGTEMVSPDTPKPGAALPDAPVAAGSFADREAGAASAGVMVNDPAGSAVRTKVTGRFDRFIDPTEIAPRLSSKDKVLSGVRGTVSILGAAGWVGGALYGETFDRSPNYGQSGQAFAQRLGAAAAKNSSEGIFSNAVFAPIFHTDPRYYQLGPGHSGLERSTYAISRVLVTRTDAGKPTFNAALLAGNLAGSSLTQLYYPSQNRSVSEVMTTFGTSLGGSALANLLGEFFSQTAERWHLK